MDIQQDSSHPLIRAIRDSNCQMASPTSSACAPSRQATAGCPHHASRLPLAAIIALGAFFRFYRLGHHGLWIDPENSDYLVNTNDGGIYVSYDAGENWRNFLDIMPLVQFFNVNYDMDDPFNVYGSIQDHGSRRH